MSLRRSGAGSDASLDAPTTVRALLDLDADAPAIAARAARDPLLAPLVAREPGRRVPGTVDRGEICFRAVLGQQISLGRRGHARGPHRRGRRRAARLRRTARSRTPLPAPEAIAAVPDSVAGDAGVAPRARSALWRPRCGGAPRPGPLLALPGIGPWTASYIAMRALGDPDAFLPTDLGVRHALERLGVPAARAERWRPYRAYAVVHLWGALG